MEAPTTRRTIKQIVQAAKDKALVEIITTGKPAIESAFAALKAEAAELKGFDKDYVPPWETPTVPAPAPVTDPAVRKYRMRNAKDAIVHAVHSLAAEASKSSKKYQLGDIHEELKSQGYNYAYVTLSIAGSAITGKFMTGQHTDPQGRKVNVRFERGWNFFSAIAP